MKGIAGLIAALAAILVLIVLSSSLYTVDVREQVIITQFGEPVGEPVTDPGLYFKLPFIQKVNVLDRRWLEWDGEVDEMRTAERTPILVDSYARWRIKDPKVFFVRLKTEQNAQSRIDDIIESETRNVLAAHKLIEVVRSTNRVLPPSDGGQGASSRSGEPPLAAPDAAPEAAPPAVAPEQAPPGAAAVSRQGTAPIEFGRERLTRMILEKVQEVVPELGIEVVDLRFQRVNYTPEVEQKVFERMISERKRIAARYRSEGQGESARIQGRMTEDLKRIESEAYRTEQETKGGADARATTIYSQAHNLDPDLYRLLKSLESYQSTVDEDTSLLLSTDAEFFRALQSSR